MNGYVDVSDFVADYDRRQDCQAALSGDNAGDDDDITGGIVDDNDTGTDD